MCGSNYTPAKAGNLTNASPVIIWKLKITIHVYVLLNIIMYMYIKLLQNMSLLSNYRGNYEMHCQSSSVVSHQ